MKNVIFCVIDAFCYNNIDMVNGNDFVTPFLSNMAATQVSFDNTYSIAPYTEASFVTILGEELCLENGGYLFGNGTTNQNLFQAFQKKGYKTVYEYLPYIYSKSYLKNVDKYFYSRPYSLVPLYNSRLQYYKEIQDSRGLKDIEIDVCAELLEEAFVTWLDQCKKGEVEDDTCKAIMHILPKNEVLKRTYKFLSEEISIFHSAKHDYIVQILDEWEEHKLWKMNMEYLRHDDFPLNTYVLNKYSEVLRKYQNKISKINRKQHIDFRYLFSVLFNNRNGKKDAIGLCKNYIKHYIRKPLENYLSDLKNEGKKIAGMYRTFEYAYDTISKYDKENTPYFLYLHLEDFHLPSVFHSYDTDKKSIVDEEFAECDRFICDLQDDFKGNVISALSAHFCDYRIKEFYEKCKRELKNDFVFVITADHGYPSYNNPPRPYTYNQTYTEAFHVPFIVIDGDLAFNKYTSLILSNRDVIQAFKNFILEQKIEIQSKGYVLTEYAGPGCPVIVEKPVWYTYIDDRVRLSVQAMLGTDITYSHITDIYDLNNDSDEKYNLRKKKSKYIDKVLEIINERHKYLSEKYNRENFYDQMFKKLN